MFELNRGLFYKKLFNNDQEHSVTESELGEIKEFWTNIYSPVELNIKENSDCLDLTGNENNNIKEQVKVTHKELGEAIKYLRNWAAPGPDRIHNFFLKYITAGHPQMRTSIKNN